MKIATSKTKFEVDLNLIFFFSGNRCLGHGGRRSPNWPTHQRTWSQVSLMNVNYKRYQRFSHFLAFLLTLVVIFSSLDQSICIRKRFKETLGSNNVHIQGHPERMIKVKQFSRVLIFAKVRFSQLF